MQTATTADLVALTDIVRSLRPDWDRWLIESILQSHHARVHVADLVVACTRYARDLGNTDPRGMCWRGQHWRGLDTQPNAANSHVRCYVCGKPQDRCLNERPGPDDHAFEPADARDVKALR